MVLSGMAQAPRHPAHHGVSQSGASPCLPPNGGLILSPRGHSGCPRPSLAGLDTRSDLTDPSDSQGVSRAVGKVGGTGLVRREEMHA